jgi:zinc transport system ATP-binding protein
VQADHLIARRMGELSGGELQRVMLACALDPTPDLLLLDEPVSGVDPRGMEIFYRMVSELRKNYDLSVLLVSHDLGLLARFAERLVFLNQTVLAVGSPDEVLRTETVRKTFGTEWINMTFQEHAAAAVHHAGGGPDA